MDKFEFSIKIPIQPKAKFGLKAILFGTLFIALGFGAFKFGKERGHREGYTQGYENGWFESQKSKLTKREYRVSDLVEAGPKTMPNLERLRHDIQQAVEQSSWDANGGPAEILSYPLNLSVVVNQTQRGHEAVEQYLNARREANVLGAP